ncbi:hypothetical protein pb186bvf_014030 [Paramecium bursaria]
MNKTNLLQGESQESESVFDDSKNNDDQLDKQLREGPLKNRQVKDRFCIGLFFIMWLIMLAFCGVAHYNGDLRRVINPYNSNGEQCGIEIQEEYQYVYIISYNQYYCVKDCPGEKDIEKPLQCLECNQVVTYETQQVISLCIPSITDKSIYDLVVSMVETGPLQQFWGDIKEASYYILLCAFIAFVLCLILFAAMGKAAWCIVWGMITLFICSLITIGVVAYIQQTSSDLDDYQIIHNNGTLLFIQWTALVIAILFMILVCAFMRYINFAIAFLKAAGAFMSEQCELFFLPIISFGMIIGMFVFWLQTSALIYSTGDFHRSQIHPYNEFVLNQSNVVLLLFYFFGLIFNINFFISFTQFVTASTCCFWYYKNAGADVSPLAISIKRGATYHLGSIIFWSIYTFNHLDIQNYPGDNLFFYEKKNGKLIIDCFVKYIRYLNYNAFIMIALNGDAFFLAGIKAISLLVRNIDRVFVTHHLGGIIEFIGSLFVTAGITTYSYYLFTESKYEIKDVLSSPVGPMIIVGIVSYMIGRIFMCLYAMGVDCILLCYMDDCQKNNGAQNTPPTLRHFIEEHQ